MHHHVLKSVLILIIVFSAVGMTCAYGMPSIKDQDLIVEKVVSDICCRPTTMAFIDDDVLILEQENGKVRLVRDGIMKETPVLDLNVRGIAEQGLLGITTVDHTVYLYFTESTHDGGEAIANRIYRYDWTGQELTNQVLVKELPGKQFYHNGGAMVTGLDDTVYAVIGDQGTYGFLQNHGTGGKNDTSVILRVNPPGPYYAMGIRNSFGLAIDPLTGNLWDTENGDDDFDEINFVPPNFNSGWDVIMGPATETELSRLPGYDGYVYSDPEFSWQKVVVPTAISFVDSKPLEKYKNSVFVGDCIQGNLYKFELNQDRTGFVFNDPRLADNVVNTGESLEEITFGTGFDCITDIEVGPDGLMYIVSRSHDSIYRIMPKTMMIQTDTGIDDAQPTIFPVEYTVYAIIAVLIIVSIVVYLTKTKKKTALS
jgi:glucose/arabinose dehydrogenase